MSETNNTTKPAEAVKEKKLTPKELRILKKKQQAVGSVRFTSPGWSRNTGGLDRGFELIRLTTYPPSIGSGPHGGTIEQ